MACEIGPTGLINFRDLGGMRSTAERETRRGLVYRSESLASVSGEDAEILCRHYGIGNFIDLRSAGEVEAAPPSWISRQGLGYRNLPFSDGFDEIRADLTDEELHALVPQKYASYLKVASANVVKALESIAAAASEGIPTLVACTYGKDRTGVLAAILLELLGVDRRFIVDDYVATTAAMEILIGRMSSDPLHGPRLATAPRQIYLATQRSIETFLRDLDSAGGAQAWATRAGLTSSSIELLRQHLVVTSK